MKPSEIRNFIFDKGAFGYKPEEVENCLNDIADFVESMQNEYAQAQKEIQELKDRMNHLREDEESIKQIIISAQRLSTTVTNEAKDKANEMTDNAKKESERILAQATEKAKTIVSEAEERARRIEKEIVEVPQKMAREAEAKADAEEKKFNTLQKEVSEFKASLLTLYKKHLDLITQLPEKEEFEPKKEVSEEATDKEAKEAGASVTATETPVVKKTETPVEPNVKEGVVSSGKKEEKEAAKPAPFKITITEKKPKEKDPMEESKQASFRQMKEDEKFHSRFGELKFGSNLNKEKED